MKLDSILSEKSKKLINDITDMINKFEIDNIKEFDEQVISVIIINSLATVIGMSVGTNINLTKINTKIGESKTKGEMVELLHIAMDDIAQVAEMSFDMYRKEK